MNRQDALRREVREILIAASADEASDEQLQKLNGLLEQDDSLQEYVSLLLHQIGNIRWSAQQNVAASLAAVEGCASDKAPNATTNVPVLPQAGQIIPLRFWLPFAAAFLGGVLIHWGFQTLTRSERALRHDAKSERGIANEPLVYTRLVGTTQCYWENGSIQPAVGEALRVGESLNLLEGIAELSVSSEEMQVTMQLEGPVAMVLTAEGLPSLRYGKVTVQSAGLPIALFPVETPFGRLLLRPDSEVGLSAFGSAADVHVFKGQVMVESPWLISQDIGQPMMAIQAGQSLSFENVGGSSLQVRRGAADRAHFAPVTSMDADFLAIGPEYIQEIRRAGPVAYWRFESADDGIVQNEMGKRFFGKINKSTELCGPKGNRAIQLGMRPASGAVVFPEASWDEVFAGDFSLEAWIKPSHYHLGAVLGLVGEFDSQDRRNPHGILLEVCGTSQPSSWHIPQRVRFLHRSPVSTDVNLGVSCFSGTSYTPRRWHHVVALRKADELKLYLNGKLTDAARDESSTPPGLQFLIGQLYSEANVNRFFVGRMDEVAVYDRSLTHDEIKRHFELVRAKDRELEAVSRPSS